jgi:hypothetical protein
MDVGYSIAGVTMRLSHQDDGLFRALDSELGFYRRKEPAAPDCAVLLSPGRRGLAAPEKAVRTNVWEGKSVFSRDGKIHIMGEGGAYLASIDYRKKELSIEYDEAGGALEKVARWLVKWLIITAAQEKGLTYVHASAASFMGRSVIFCGDSNCGKSSSLLRLLSMGAEAISDDSVLFDGERIIPFSMNTTMDPDLEGRFGLKEGFQIGSVMDVSASYGRPDTVIFLRIWNSGESESRPMDYGRALSSLMGTYRKEVPFLWAGFERQSSGKEIFERYAEFLEGASIHELFAGHDEENVRKELASLLSGKGKTPR